MCESDGGRCDCEELIGVGYGDWDGEADGYGIEEFREWKWSRSGKDDGCAKFRGSRSGNSRTWRTSDGFLNDRDGIVDGLAFDVG